MPMQRPALPPISTAPPPEGVMTVPRVKWSQGTLASDSDHVVVEEPLEIRLGAVPLAVVMRTPGHDLELATGFCITERILASPAQIRRVSHCNIGEHADNIVIVLPDDDAEFDTTNLTRNLYTTSSCGICGKRSLEQALRVAPPLQPEKRFDLSTLALAPEALRKLQPLFQATGAIHAAGLLSPQGEVVAVREDIGRHNAVDKVIGYQLREGQALSSSALVTSGRASFEIVQKALAATIPCVVSVGGVSSLAIELAKAAGITLVGFARGDRLSIYAGSAQ